MTDMKKAISGMQSFATKPKKTTAAAATQEFNFFERKVIWLGRLCTGKFIWKIFKLIVLAGTALFLIRWIFEPVFHNFDPLKDLDLNDRKSYWVVDRYAEHRMTVPGNLEVSVVIPSYNDIDRFKPMIDQTIQYFDKWSHERGFTYEILFVDDGSTDDSFQYVIENYHTKYPEQFRVLRLKMNQGKGAAVKLGVQFAHGKYILMADADGATNIEDFEKLYTLIKPTERILPGMGDAEQGMMVGSRAHLESTSIVKRSLHRTVLMKGFHVLVYSFVSRKIRDTQCGFKLFSAASAKRLFGNMHLRRWAFDIELIYMADKLGIPMMEVGVDWHEVEGSKLIIHSTDVITTSLHMARDIACVFLSYNLGFWDLPVASREKDEL